MKTYSDFKDILFGVILVLFLCVSCEIERIENDIGSTDLRASARTTEQVFTFKGNVYEALDYGSCSDYRDKVPITKARVELADFDLLVITNTHGEFTLKLPMSKLIETYGQEALTGSHQFRFNVKKEGYIESILTYDYDSFYEGASETGYASNFMAVDFPLTPRSEHQTVTADGGVFRFGNIVATVPAGAVSEDTPFSVTKIARDEFKGNSNKRLHYGVRETELERIEVYPMTLEFNEPITITFETSGLIKDDRLEVTVLNEQENIWMDEAINFQRSNNSMSFSTQMGGTCKCSVYLANHNCEIISDEMMIDSRERSSASNCACSSAMPIRVSSSKLLREEIEFGREISDELAREIVYQVRRSGNIPSANTSCNFDGKRLYYYNVSCPVEMTLDQCQTVDMDFDQRTRVLKGNVYGVDIVYRFSYTYDVANTLGKCATTTACHQGCHG